MTQRALTQAPPGVQCFVGSEARRRRAIQELVVSVFEGWDYEEIIPPLFDGSPFPAAVARGRVLGTQFHPEKSQNVGLRMVENFVEQVAISVAEVGVP